MFNLAKKNIPTTLFMLFILCFGAKYMFMGSMESFPNYVHAWTQSDRLAIAQNFQENGFDFFHPQTYNLITKDGITQVDFPIHDYLSACISSFFKIDLILVFRWYNLIYSLVGIFFLYQILLLYTKSAARSVFGASFIFTIPFFVYYENGFLPSAPSFANFLIGFYFVSLHGFTAATKGRIKYYSLGILFLTLAALARAPFIIFLFAQLLHTVWMSYQRRQYKLYTIIIPIIGIACFIGYYLYNQHLAEVYGSMFLSEFLYFKSFSQFIQIVNAAIDRWGFQLMSPYHSFLYLAFLSALLYQVKTIKITSKDYSLLSYSAIASLGVLLFFFAFGQQFRDHDYYYIDSFLPLLSLTIIYGLTKVRIHRKWYTTIGTISFIFYFYFFSYAKQTLTDRYTPNFDDRLEYAYSVYKNAKGDLLDWGVNKEDTLYIMDANSTNIPFIVWGNKGYTNLTTSKEVMDDQLDSNFTYALLVDSFFRSSTFKGYPGIINKLKYRKGNGQISLYEKSTENDPSLFFKNLIYFGTTDFDSTNTFPKQSATIRKTDNKHQKSAIVGNNNLYSLTVKVTPQRFLYDQPVFVLFNADYYQTDSSSIQIVCTHDKYYSTHYTASELDSIGSWESKQFRYTIDPKYFNEEKEIAFYFWNPEKSTITVDNLNLLIYQ